MEARNKPGASAAAEYQTCVHLELELRLSPLIKIGPELFPCSIKDSCNTKMLNSDNTVTVERTGLLNTPYRTLNLTLFCMMTTLTNG